MENEKFDRDLKATIKKNWRLFKQSRLGMTGLGIVVFFGFLSIVFSTDEALTKVTLLLSSITWAYIFFADLKTVNLGLSLATFLILNLTLFFLLMLFVNIISFYPLFSI